MKSHYPNCKLGDQCNCDEIDWMEDESEGLQHGRDGRP